MSGGTKNQYYPSCVIISVVLYISNCSIVYPNSHITFNSIIMSAFINKPSRPKESKNGSLPMKPYSGLEISWSFRNCCTFDAEIKRVIMIAQCSQKLKKLQFRIYFNSNQSLKIFNCMTQNQGHGNKEQFAWGACCHVVQLLHRSYWRNPVKTSVRFA